jgi:hypothetical protein
MDGQTDLKEVESQKDRKRHDGMNGVYNTIAGRCSEYVI